MSKSQTSNISEHLVSLLGKPLLWILLPLFVVLTFGAATEYLSHEHKLRKESERRQEAIQTAGTIRAVLESELNASAYLTNGIESYIVAHHGAIQDSEVESMLKLLYERGRHIRDIGLAPDNKISHIVPLAGNEKVIGLYFPDVPQQWPTVEQTIRERTPRLAGPLKLIEGREGFVYRIPVFLDGHYWGLISTAIDTQSLFSALERLVPEHAGQMALRGRDGKGAQGEIFYGDSRLFTTDSPTMEVNVPGGTWQLVVKLPDVDHYVPLVRIFGWIATFLLSGMSLFLIRAFRRQGQLMQNVSEQNSLLEKAHLESIVTHKQLQQLSRAVENSPVSIVITDRDGLIEYVNPKFTVITGYSAEETIGKNPSILKADKQIKEFYSEMWETICAGQEWYGEFCNKKKSGEVFWERASISPIKNEQGVITHFVAIKEDVTKQRQIAEELKIAKDAADAANRSKSEFLANMSHEIRTPLNAIIGFSALTLKASLPPQQQDYIGKIHSAGELLLNIINDILDFSKIDAKQLKMEQIPFRLNVMIANAASMVQQKALNKGLKLQIETSPDATPYLIGDPHRLCQIIVNLLNNAVKFTEQGEIVLETSLLIRLLDRIKLKFSIRDTGIGISAEQMQKLFQPFTQADGSITRKFGGTGLGLSISRQLAELMGGEIWCESTVGIGSSFIFTAWFGIGQVNDIESCSIATMSSNSIQQTFDLSGVNILLVEDNNINQQLVIEILKETNATVIVAENGSEAVTMTTTGSRHYDLVLMDIQMPIMDGYEATRLIKADKRFKDLPLIAMTAHALQKEHDKIMQAGMITHITKPINAQIMLQTIGEILGKQKTSMPLCELPADISDNDVAIPCIDGLDVSGALDNLGGDRNLYLWILHTFIESESNAALVIEAELHSGDAALAARHAHSIKGNAGAMGAMKLQELALSLEQSIIQGGSPESIQSSLELFSSELNRLVTELTYQLPLVAENLDDACSEELDLTVVTPILDVVLGYINSWDAKAEHYLDGYHDELSCLPGDDIVHIKNHLKKFDFAAARIALLELSGKYSIILSTDAKGENSQS